MNKRPLSPHLQIYKPQITSVLSILHRLTGLALSLGFIVLAFWLAAAALGDEYYGCFQAFFSGFFGKTILFGWTLALFYHLCNGIRHLFWDIGYGFNLKTVRWSGWLVVIASILLTLVVWWLGVYGECQLS